MSLSNPIKVFVNKFKEWHDNALEGFSVKMTINRDGTPNLFEWTCSMPGPEASPYAGCVLGFRVLLSPKDYDQIYVIFVPPLFHPNVDDFGEMKIPFGHLWPSLTVHKIMTNIYLQLIAPCPSNTINDYANHLYKYDLNEYKRVAKELMHIHHAEYLQYNATPNPN